MGLSAFNLWLVPATITRGMAPDEIDREFRLMMLRSQATDLFLAGQLTMAEYLDLQSEHGIDPGDYLDCLEANLETCVDRRIIVVPG